MDRIIFHCDCNNFFASCECLERPELKNVPMAVAGDPQRRTGIVVAKNELAKKYGVKTTDTVYAAQRKCPQIVFVPPRHGLYGQISRAVNRIYAEYTDYVEPASIDESYLDMTGYLCGKWKEARAAADELRRRVREEIGVTISVGVSFNKVFAKLGSDMKKPDATTVISRENYRKMVWNLPVTDMLFVGKAAGEVLQKHYIMTIGDLAQAPEGMLIRLLGKGGEGLKRHANGDDREPVRKSGEHDEIKSVSRGMTFPRDLVTEDEVRSALCMLADEVATQLRRCHMKGNVVQLQIKTPGLTTISRQQSLPYSVCTRHEILESACSLVEAHWKVGSASPIRAMTVGVTRLGHSESIQEQMSLLDVLDDVPAPPAHSHAAREKQEKLEAAIDKIRDKHGRQVIHAGLSEDDDIGLLSHKPHRGKE